LKFTTLLQSYYRFFRDFSDDLFDDKIGHYASSLSWSTLFSIIPLLVVLLWGFATQPLFHAYHNQIKVLIFSNLMPTNYEVIRDYIDTFMKNANQLGYIGIGYVAIASVLFFKNYDYIVNDIFGAPKRGIWEAFRTYGVILVSIPLMMGLSFYLSSVIQSYLDKNPFTNAIHLFIVVPYLIVWMIFYILYQYSVNTRVSLYPALVSSFIASLVWYLSKSGFVFYVTYNQTYTSVYGSVSILLFFFLWIYLSWAIFLHGLKFCDLLNRGEEE